MRIVRFCRPRHNQFANEFASGVPLVPNLALDSILPESARSKQQELYLRGRNIKGRPFWSRVWVLASIPTERNALNG